jgi:CRISPR-associated protein Cas2
MVVMILEKVPTGLRGELSHWLIEVKTGVFLGNVSARVRDKLWEHCMKNKNTGGVFQAWNSNNEQGYLMRLNGMNNRQVVDWEGVQLIQETGNKISEVQSRRINRKKIC